MFPLPSDTRRYKAAAIQAAQEKCSLATLRALVQDQEPARDLLAALTGSKAKRPRLIAECRPPSVAEGIRVPSAYEPEELALSYQHAGAAALAVLSEGLWCGGDLTHIRQVRAVSALPIVAQDLVIDEYQIWQSRYYGADSFLLRAGLLDKAELQYFLEIGRELGMEALVEACSARELQEVLQTDARLVSISQRDLSPLELHMEHGRQLLQKFRKQAAKETIFAWDAGVLSSQDIAMMQQVGYKAFVVGEILMQQA